MQLLLSHGFVLPSVPIRFSLGFAVADHSLLVALPCSLILTWPIVFAVTDHSFLVASKYYRPGEKSDCEASH